MIKDKFQIAGLFLLVTFVSLRVIADENCDTISEIDGLTMDFILTTQEMPSSIVPTGKKSMYSLGFGHQFTVIENMLHFTSDMRTGDRIFISDMKGKRIFGYVHELDISRIKLPVIKPGIYIVSKIRNGKLVNKNQVVIGLSSK